MHELNMSARKKRIQNRLDSWPFPARNKLARQHAQDCGFALSCSMFWAFCLVVTFAIGLPINFVSAQDAQVHQVQQVPDLEAVDAPIDRQAIMEKLLKRQSDVQKLLPKMLAVTVCLTNGQGSGSGVIIDKGGLILTAAHVVEGNKTMTVKFADGRNLTCKVLGIYNPADAAMAQIIEEGEYEFATAAPEGTLEIGQTVLATGHPSGFDDQRGIPLRMGHIVAFKDSFYSSDAALIGGDSGGPAFNVAGEVIGIHSHISSDMSVNNDVHIDAFWENWDQMKSGRTVGGELLQPANDDPSASKKLVLGVQLIYSLVDEPVRVKSVAENTPADWAGLQKGDVILTVNGKQPKSSLGLMKELLRGELGRELELKIRRGDQELTLDAKLLTNAELIAERNRRRGDDSKKKDPEGKDLEKKILEKKDLEKKDLEKNPEPATDTGKENACVPTLDSVHPHLCSFAAQDEQQKEAIQKLQGDQESATQDDGQESDLQKLLEQSRKDRGRLKVDRERLKEYRNQLARRVEKLGVTGGRKADTWSSDFQNAFADTAAAISQSTFPVMTGGRHVASALLVEPRGYLVTKASEVEGRKVIIRLKTDVDTEATIVRIQRDLDLALLKIELTSELKNLPYIDLADHATRRGTDPAQGMICGAVNHLSDKIAGFGVVSVAVRALNGNTSAFLGADPADAEETAGALLKTVQPAGPADRAGLNAGDVIESVDGQIVNNSDELVKIIQSRLPHEDAKFNIRRGDRWLTLPVRLGDKSKVAPMPGAKEQSLDRGSTGLSQRRWNFAQGIQHDCAIHPKDCGGALVDLAGRVIGVNIARAGRIKSYAIPVKLASEFVASAITNDLSQDPIQGGENE